MADATLGVSRKNKNCDWAFNLRAYLHDSSDSEDDVAPPQSHKGHMQATLNDFDLSSREETVVYKPNPFSIAKVNATYRSARKKDSEYERDLTTGVQTARSKRPGGVQTRLTDTFKTPVSKRTVHLKHQKKFPEAQDATVHTEGSNPGIISSISSREPLASYIEVPSAEGDRTLPSTACLGMVLSSDGSTKFPSGKAHIAIETASSDSPSNDVPVVDPIVAVSVHTGESSLHSKNNRNLAGSSFSSPLRPQVGSSRNRNFYDKCGSSPLKALGKRPVRTVGAGDHGLFSIKQKEDFPVVGMQGRKTLHGGTKSLSKTYCRESITSYHDTFVDVSSPSSDLASRDSATPPRPLEIQVQSLNKLQVRRPGVSKPIPIVPFKRSPKDAYSFAVTDPDDEWTTLPARKKHKSEYLNQSSTSASFTKPFRLPGLQLPSKVTKINPNNTTSKRIITYFPPSMTLPAVHPDKQVQRGNVSPIGGQDINKPQHDTVDGYSSPVHIDAISYPSPRHTRMAMHPGAQIKSVVQEAYSLQPPEDTKQIFEGYYLLSPPTSDPVMHLEDDAHARIRLDPQIIRKRYSQVRAALRKVSPFLFMFFTLLSRSHPELFSPCLHQ